MRDRGLKPIRHTANALQQLILLRPAARLLGGAWLKWRNRRN